MKETLTDEATQGFQSKDELIDHLRNSIKEWVAERDYFEKASAMHYDLWQAEKGKVEEMQKTLERIIYSGHNMSWIEVHSIARQTLQSLKEDKPNETTI